MQIAGAEYGNGQSIRHFSLPEVLYVGNAAEQPLRNQFWLVAKCKVKVKSSLSTP